MKFAQRLDEFFHISKRGSSFKVEVMGGLTTFLTMSYIIFVHPSILELTGMDKNALITVTCLVSIIGTLLMAFMGNVPIALAPGMGLNAFFTFGLVQGQGVSWEVALGVVFLSGIFFSILAVSGIRQRIAKSVPHELIMSATAGIGLFITFIGLQNMGIIVSNPATMVALGEFSPKVSIAVLGLLIMIALEIKKIQGGILIGIVITSVLGMLLGIVEVPKSIFAMPASIEPIAFKLDIIGALQISLLSSVFSFMFIDMFDSLAQLLSCSKQIGNEDDLDLGKMLRADVLATLAGATLGSSTVTSFGESAAGVAVGARTGFAAIVVAILFSASLFLIPLISVVPIFAASPALVITGVYMFKAMIDVDLTDMKTAVPCFIMMIFMPLTYSISEGLAFGFLSYIFVHIMSNEWKKISPMMWLIGLLSIVNFMV